MRLFNQKNNFKKILMNLSDFAIKNLLPFVTGDGYPPTRSGDNLVTLFNRYGCRDVYDFSAGGLPINPSSTNGQRFSRKQYVESRLKQLSGTNNLRLLLENVLNALEDRTTIAEKINAIIQDERYSITEKDGIFHLLGGIVIRTLPIQNQAHFRDIENRILEQLDNARVSIHIVMAWFTNETLFSKLIEKQEQGLDVQLLIFDDGVNRKHGVDFNRLNCTHLKRGLRGGLMHDKFCIIDNQIVITGSYNWTNNAEHRNDENISTAKDPEQATRYSIEFIKLKRDNLLKTS